MERKTEIKFINNQYVKLFKLLLRYSNGSNLEHKHIFKNLETLNEMVSKVVRNSHRENQKRKSYFHS